jgi:hypothetical protein
LAAEVGLDCSADGGGEAAILGDGSGDDGFLKLSRHGDGAWDGFIDSAFAAGWFQRLFWHRCDVWFCVAVLNNGKPY